MSRGVEQMSEFIRDARRDQIADTARRLFAEDDTSDVSIEDIAAAAGVSRSTIYNHFADRDEILQVCLARGARILLDRLDELTRRTAEPRDRPVAIFEALITEVDSNRALFGLGLAFTAGRAEHTSPAVSAEFLVLGTEVAGMLRQALRALDDADALAEGRSIDSTVAFASRILFGVLTERLSGDRAAPPSHLARDSWRLLLPEVYG